MDGEVRIKRRLLPTPEGFRPLCLDRESVFTFTTFTGITEERGGIMVCCYQATAQC